MFHRDVPLRVARRDTHLRELAELRMHAQRCDEARGSDLLRTRSYEDVTVREPKSASNLKIPGPR